MFKKMNAKIDALYMEYITLANKDMKTDIDRERMNQIHKELIKFGMIKGAIGGAVVGVILGAVKIGAQKLIAANQETEEVEED